MEMPSYDIFNDKVDQLLGSLKYIKLHKLIFEMVVKILEQIGYILSQLFMKSSSTSGATIRTQIIVGLIAITIIIIIIILIIFLLIRRRHKKKVRSILGEKINKDSTVISFLDKSKFYEEKGEYRQAVRLRFVAALFFLHQAHILYHDYSMTGKEMVTKLKEDKYIAVEDFETITNGFNKIWYSMTEIDVAAFKVWCEEENSFWREVEK
ncbi:MAG: hypothetical protein CVV02_04205 [Firmicutes bacterium HGW-Firmicutes-7]|nr:MAG: hypothetical protein CVV02_04205 [Firmicutes bacterium HGW-Firmicutes-7]